MKTNGFRSALFASAAIAAGFALASVSPRCRTPGIMGGMGPAATCDLMAKVIAMTDAADDQHHKAIGNGVGMTHSCFGRFYSEFGRWVKSSP